MNAFTHQLSISLRLYFRNTMAMIYGYVFPTIFLIAFWVLYRYDRVPIARHLGELLTIAVLGGACFGLPTTLVGERERGVWRRYRLTPVPTGALVASTVVARYVILITAGVLQILLAMALGMPLPRHPIELWLAFTLVAFAFLGLGLVIAMLADNVPAVQALGQCLFLPMLIIGGIAVPLASLPDWAQHVSAFFPGRYAVDAIQATVTGNGLGAVRFSLLALLLIGAAGCLAGARLFRWDAQQRFASLPGKAWVGVALVAWVAVGLAAERRGNVVSRPSQESVATPAPAESSLAAGVPETVKLSPAEKNLVAPVSTPGGPPTSPPSSTKAAPSATAIPPAPAGTAPVAVPNASPKMVSPDPVPPATPTVAPPPGSNPPAAPAPKGWQAVSMVDIERDLIFSRLPSDDGVVTPIAPVDEVPAQDVIDELEGIRAALPTWKPGKVEDLVQRARNLLYVAAVPDIFQMSIERYLPQVIFDQLLQAIAKDDLIKILYWIGMHPMDGTDNAVDQLRSLGLGNGPSDAEQLRERTAIYAVKLLGQLTGKRPAK